MISRFFSAFIILCVFSAPLAASAAVHVNGYYRKDGTYVAPHYRSDPDSSPYNNWSYPGNVNPYSGKVAPGNPDTYLKNYYGGTGSLPAISAPAATVPASTLTRDQQIAQLQALVQLLLQIIAEMQRQNAIAPPATTTPI